MDTIGERIRNKRKELKLTQTDIKALTGISSGNLSDIENNKALPSANALISLSRELRVTTDWILKGESSNCIYESVNSTLSTDESSILSKFKHLSSSNKIRLLERADILLEEQAEANRLHNDMA